MDLNWDLRRLYESFSGEDFQNDLVRLDKLIHRLNEMSQEVTKNHENEGRKLENYITLSEELAITAEKLGVFAFLTTSVNAKDEEGKIGRAHV